MTDVTIEQQLQQANDQIKGLTAQLEAAKGMVNDGLNVQLQLRTNLHLLMQQAQDLGKENHQLRTTVDTLTKKILELSPPKENENAVNKVE